MNRQLVFGRRVVSLSLTHAFVDIVQHDGCAMHAGHEFVH